MSLPLSDRMGMFWILGFTELKRPVDVTVWLNVVWILSETATFGNAFT